MAGPLLHDVVARGAVEAGRLDALIGFVLGYLASVPASVVILFLLLELGW